MTFGFAGNRWTTMKFMQFEQCEAITPTVKSCFQLVVVAHVGFSLISSSHLTAKLEQLKRFLPYALSTYIFVIGNCLAFVCALARFVPYTIVVS
jgi:hypothetical protein